MFAKIFEHSEYGQFLVMKDRDDEGDPCVKVSCEPGGILGVCTLSLGYDDDENGWETRNKAFDAIDLEKAVSLTDHVREMAGELSND